MTFFDEDAIEWGECPDCGAGEHDPDCDDPDCEEGDVPLFECGDDVLCASCCAARSEAR